jgi:RHS repeat-associated protein
MYAYDRSGSLRWVVTPEGTSRIGNEASTIGTTSDFASKYCYVYVRDSRDRVVEKRIPGAEATYQVYDLAGRLMMSQDGNQRSGGKWSVFSYDESGRILEERLIAPANCPPRAALQAAFYSGNTPSTYYAAGTTLRECTYDTYPSSMDSSLSFVAVPGVVADSTRISDISSMLSYERVNVLGTETYATRAFYYDKHGHVVQTVEKRPDGEILRTSLLFDLRGNVLASQSHFTIASLNINDILASTFTYDSRGRKLTETSTLNGNVAIANVAYSYDNLGRLSVRSYNSEAEYPLEEDLSYNMQGWLNGQDDHTSDVNVFSSTLRYYDSFNGSVPRYGGDISSCSWIQYVQGGTRTYAFSYDPLSRLSGADQYGGSSLENRFTERGISYDRNGNITAITRHNNSASGTAKTFSYSGNRRVSNSYDANGNVTYDSESGVIASYNLINLPSSLITGDYNIYYDYLADGTKLRTQQEELWTGYTYAGPFRYNDNDGSLSLESVAFGEGRFVRTGTGARNFATRYFIKDHLGSVRVVADDNGTALERDDYLPYGERANDPALTRNGNNFLYGGKELQDRDDIDWYDSGARFQTTSGIFTSIDPEAEKYYPISPYAYCTGNPVNHIDPNGREVRVAKDYQEQFRNDLQNVFGDRTNMLSFNDNGTLQLDGKTKDFNKGMTKDQKKAFKGLNKAMNDKQVTSVVYADDYSVTVGNEIKSVDIIKEYGGGLYSATDNVIIIAPNVRSVDVTLDQMQITDNGFSFPTQNVQQNTTSALFHEIGERNTTNINFRGAVIDFENYARRVIGLPVRPYDLNHSRTIKTNYTK